MDIEDKIREVLQKELQHVRTKHKEELIERITLQLVQKLERKHTGRITTDSFEMNIEKSGRLEIRIYDTKYNIVIKNSDVGMDYIGITTTLPKEDAEKVYKKIL